MIYLLSVHEIMFYFIFVYNYIWILDKAFNIDFCLFNFVHVLLFTISLSTHWTREVCVLSMTWLDVCTCSVWRGQLLSPDRFFHRDVRCLFEVGISMVMYAQVGLFVHALSILNFDGLYIAWFASWTHDII
jgi:hypothetical protein